MTSGVRSKNRPRSEIEGESGYVIESVAKENERLKAMVDFKKNMKQGEYIDHDLYRGDVRVLSALSSSVDENIKHKNEGKSANMREAPKAKFVHVSAMGKKLRGFIWKLTGKMNCFGKSSARKAEIVESEVGSPIKVDTQPTSLGSRGESSKYQEEVDSVSQAHGGKAAKQTNGGIEGTVTNRQEEVAESPEMNDISKIEEGIIPRRVKSMVGSGENFSVVKKGMIERTLEKLRSTGSFVFNEPRSVINQERETLGDNFLPDQDPRQDSRSLVDALHEHRVRNTEKENDVNVFLRSGKGSDRDSNPSSEVKGENEVTKDVSGADVDSKPVPATYVPYGNVKRLRSLFEEDSPELPNNAFLNETSTGEAEIANDYNLPVDEPSRLCSNSSADISNAKSIVEGNEYDAPATCIPSGDVRKMRSLFEGDSDVPHNVVVHSVSSASKAMGVFSGLELSNEVGKRRAQKVITEVMCDGDGGEAPPHSHLQDLSSHLLGHVEKKKSLFDSSSSDAKICDEKVKAVIENEPLHAGLSYDSAVFDEDEEGDEVNNTELQVQSKTNGGVFEGTDAKKTNVMKVPSVERTRA